MVAGRPACPQSPGRGVCGRGLRPSVWPTCFGSRQSAAVAAPMSTTCRRGDRKSTAGGVGAGIARNDNNGPIGGPLLWESGVSDNTGTPWVPILHQAAIVMASSTRLLAHSLGKRAGRALLLLDRLFFTPYVSVETVRDELGWPYSSANGVVLGLCELGILREITGRQRGRVFRYDQYLSLFQEGKIG